MPHKRAGCGIIAVCRASGSWRTVVEATILLIMACLATGAGLAAWRALRGPARRWSGTLRRVAIVGLVAVSLVAISAWRLSRSRDLQVLGSMVKRVETATPVVALTFDDGPLPTPGRSYSTCWSGRGLAPSSSCT